jgi:hypothetical protein
MVKNKPTYITDLTTEILNNNVLLSAWAERSADMKFLDLSVAILSDIDLLFSWDCNNVLNLKLAGILSGNQDFNLKSGMLITIDESYEFPFETSSDYEFCIKEMIDMKSLSSLFKKDLINQGHSLEVIKQAERYSKISSFVHFMKETEGYELDHFKNLNEIVLPRLIERKNEVKGTWIDKKLDRLIYPNFKELVPENRENINFGDHKIHTIKPKQLPEKWYALLYWIQLTANGKLPPISREGTYIKKELEKIGREKTNKSGQGFYRSFIEIDLNNTKVLKNSYGDDWKKIIIELSDNDPMVKKYIESKYAS